MKHSKKHIRALTLIEIIIAILILFVANCCIFEILRTSYAYMTKIKIMGSLQSLTSSHLETIIFNNQCTDPTGVWIDFPADNRFKYRIYTIPLDISSSFPGYTATQVFIQARGPVNSTTIPEYKYSLQTTLLDSTQTVTETEDTVQGELLSPEVLEH